MTDSTDSHARLWHWFPEELTRFSSIWWFFILFPRQSEGYGPSQMMYSLSSLVGDRIRLNKILHAGVDRSREMETLADPFSGMALGWHYDGKSMYDGLLRHPVTIQVDPGRAIRGWDDNRHGGEIVEAEGRPLATTAFFRGEGIETHFEVWGDTVSEMTSPTEIERQSVFGGANVLPWRHLWFEGDFSTPAGVERLEGVGYFQRICLNIPPFPWKWVVARFADGSFFSCFVPFLGPHLLRRGDWFFSNRIENFTFQMQENAYFCEQGSWRTVLFSKVSVRPVLESGLYPQFLVSTTADNGDFLRFRAVPYTHTQILLERPLLGSFSSMYNYNEYPFAIEDLTGSINGKQISKSLLGSGYGNLEYTWGLGL